MDYVIQVLKKNGITNIQTANWRMDIPKVVTSINDSTKPDVRPMTSKKKEVFKTTINPYGME